MGSYPYQRLFWKSTKQANTLPALLLQYLSIMVFRINMWSHGYITPIHKGNDPSDPNNYRGITITNSLGKLFNRILDNRLTKFLDKHHVINDSQMGFTKKTRTQLLKSL
jgi:hypothetical protein